MRSNSSLAMLFLGVIVGIASVLSCSDDSPGNADAATCECPAAEPPITGRIEIVNQTQVIAANGRDSQQALCPSGSTLLSGSCTVATSTPVRDVTLEQAGFFGSENAWYCAFKNNEALEVTVKASVRCLVPAP